MEPPSKPTDTPNSQGNVDATPPADGENKQSPEGGGDEENDPNIPNLNKPEDVSNSDLDYNPDDNNNKENNKDP